MNRILPLFIASFLPCAAWSAPLISEFVSDYQDSLKDKDGHYSDWLEIHNPDGEALALGGWSLTDNPENLQKWTFPGQARVNPDSYLVVFASGKNRAGLFDTEYHTNFRIADTAEYLALVDPQGNIVSEYKDYPNQLPRVSYGETGGVRGFYVRTTPGAANGEVLNEPPAKVDFSVPGKSFTDTLTVALTCPTEGAEIRYTLDGSEPVKSLFKNSPVYTAPLEVTRTTRLRARAFLDGSPEGKITSEHYFKLGADLAGFRSSLPIVIVDSYGRNVDGDTRGSTFYPVSSLFIDVDETGRAHSTGPANFAGYGGMHVRGESSSGFAKKQYKLETWNEWDQDKDVEILGFPADSDWVLHAPYSDKTLMRNFLVYKWFGDMGHYTVRCKFFELFFNYQAGDGEVTMSDYRGVYILMENIKRGEDRVDIPGMEPWDSSEPEITGGWIFRKDKAPRAGVVIPTVSTTRESQTWQIVEPANPTDPQKTWLKNYLQAAVDALHGPGFGDPENGYAKYFDVPSMIDEHIMVELSKNIDGYRLSNYYHIDRGGKITGGPAWDYNLSLGNADYLDGWKPDGWYYRLVGGGDYPYYARLFQDPEFALAYADRWYQLRRGIFSTPSLMGDIDNTAAFIDEAQERNFTKWPRLGIYDWPNAPGEPQRDTYQKQIDFMKDWLDERVKWMDKQFEKPVAFSQQGGPVDPGHQLTMTTGGLFDQRPGTIFYTLDGTDPRLRGGAVNPAALEYAPGGVTLTESVHLRARLLRTTGAWSALNEASFVVGVPAAKDNLIISEIHYNPADPTEEEAALGFTDEQDFEFVEIMNIGDAPVELNGVRFTDGFPFDFTGSAVTSLAPGGRAVIVRRRDAFEARYGSGLPVAGAYGEAEGFNLSNGGETLEISSDYTGPIFSVTYDDEGDWPAEADGQGYALVLRQEQAAEDYNDTALWSKGSRLHGTPGGAETSIEPGQSLAAWKESVFSPADLQDPAVSGDEADWDADSLSTLMEYALHTDPKSSDAGTAYGMVVMTGDDPTVGLRFRRHRNATDVVLQIQTSANLRDWVPAGDLLDLVSSTDLGGGAAEETYRMTTPMGVEPLRFFRLHAQKRE